MVKLCSVLNNDYKELGYEQHHTACFKWKVDSVRSKTFFYRSNKYRFPNNMLKIYLVNYLFWLELTVQDHCDSMGGAEEN